MVTPEMNREIPKNIYPAKAKRKVTGIGLSP